jgi:predicted nucleic acid-binding protein
MKTTVLDSFALIAYLERQHGYEKVAVLLEECASRNREVFLCVVNWGEVIYHALRTGGEKKALLVETVMEAVPVIIIEADKNITMQAARIKACHRMSYADCFAAALAIKKKCDLITGDPEFKQVEKEIAIHWM